MRLFTRDADKRQCWSPAELVSKRLHGNCMFFSDIICKYRTSARPPQKLADWITRKTVARVTAAPTSVAGI